MFSYVEVNSPSKHFSLSLFLPPSFPMSIYNTLFTSLTWEGMSFSLLTHPNKCFYLLVLTVLHCCLLLCVMKKTRCFSILFVFFAQSQKCTFYFIVILSRKLYNKHQNSVNKILKVKSSKLQMSVFRPCPC
jgi:hypothetical protein